jgi:putative FmdB family regulatory protein
VPTYGYRCNECGEEFDVWQRMSDEAGAACPKCGSSSRRLFYPAGIVFKGSGFYKTDSRSAATAGSGSSLSSSSGSDSAPSTSTANGAAADTTTKKPDSPKPAAGSGSASKGD